MGIKPMVHHQLNFIATFRTVDTIVGIFMDILIRDRGGYRRGLVNNCINSAKSPL